MLFRQLGLYIKYLLVKFIHRRQVRFNGFTIVYTFPKSSIVFEGGE